MARARPASSPSRPAGPPAWLAAALLGLGTLAAYHNTFSVPFLFDDNTSIRDNPTIRNLLEAWWPPTGGGLTVSGRPFLNFTLALNHAVSGPVVWSYHGLNLLIHLAAGCTLFGVVRRTLERPVLAARFGRDSAWLALAVALLWTLHPLQTESVTYIIQRAESLVSLSYLLTLWCFLRSIEPGAAKKWAPLAWVACLLGMASKEVMVTAPLMLALFDRIFVAGSWREVWARRGRFHLALAGTWLLLAGLVLATGNRGGTAGLGAGVSPGAYALTQLGAVVHYLRLAFWPRPLVFDYGTALAGGWSDVWWQALVLIPLAAASLWAAWRGRPAGYAAVFFFVVLAPSSSFVPIATQTLSEHRMYLPLAGLAVLFVTGLYAAAGRKSLAVCAVLVPVLVVATVRRNHDYRTALALWQDTVDKRPGNARALNTLGALHLLEGRLDVARIVLLEAVRVDPRSAEARNSLGNVWMNSGRWAEAIECFEQALALKPADAAARTNLGNALLEAGRLTEGLAHLEAAVRAQPGLADARYNLANTLAQHGRPAEAAEHYAALLQITPDDVEARTNYGEVLLRLGRVPEAIAQLEAAVRLQPGSAGLHNNLGAALARAGRPAEALPHFQEAVRLQPDYAGARENAARAARALGGGG